MTNLGSIAVKGRHSKNYLEFVEDVEMAYMEATGCTVQDAQATTQQFKHKLKSQFSLMTNVIEFSSGGSYVSAINRFVTSKLPGVTP